MIVVTFFGLAGPADCEPEVNQCRKEQNKQVSLIDVEKWRITLLLVFNLGIWHLETITSSSGTNSTGLDDKIWGSENRELRHKWDGSFSEYFLPLLGASNGLRGQLLQLLPAM